MEPLMYSTICTMVQKETLDETVIKGREEKLKWAKRLKLFYMKDGKLLWDAKQIPTVDEFDSIVRPLQINEKGIHCTHLRKLRKAVQQRNYVLQISSGDWKELV